MIERTFTISDGAAGRPATLVGNWGSFQLLEKVGQGSFGEVYRAFDTKLQREVALKLLLPTALDADSQAETLLREARAIARVRHPNVVSVYGVDTYDGRVGFWSDFVHGKTLSAIVDADGPFGPKEAALIGVDLCKAVGAVHVAGLLHRDIKTANVMRESGGRILLLDFGLTQEHGVSERLSGTVLYMAPEVLAGQPASTASDIYALGILLFHLLTGKYPVDGTTLQGIRSAHDSGARQPLLDVRPDMPESLTHVIELAANPDPAKRYKSTGQMIAALTEAVGLNGSSPDMGARTAFRRGRRWFWAVVPVVLLALALIPLRNSLLNRESTTPPASVADDYGKAHDLLEHYYRPGALDTAIALLEETVAKDPRFAPGFADLGRANLLQFIQLRDPKYIEPTRVACERALSLKPNLASAHVTLGRLYTWTNKTDLATQELDDALKLNKFDAAAYAALGGLLLNQGRSVEAEPMLEKAVSLAPRDWGILVQLGSYYDESGKYAKATEEYEQAAEVAPDNPRAQNNLGYIYRLQNRLPEAEAAYKKSIDLEPSAGHYRNLGQVLLEQGKYADAREMLERAVQLKPNDYRSYGFLAAAYAGAEADHAKVAETYRKAIALGEQLNSQAPSAYVLADLGGYYAALGLPKQSEPLLKQAAALQPDSGEVLYEVASGYELLHKRDQALLWIGKAVSAGIYPDFLASKPQFAALRADPRYRQVVSAAVRKP